MVVLNASHPINNKLSALARGGMFFTKGANATTGSRSYGHEFDIGGTYQLSANASFIAEYGFFQPGKFFATTHRSAADLFSLKYKFTF